MCVLQVEDRTALVLKFTPGSELPSRQAVCKSMAQFGSLDVCDVGMHVDPMCCITLNFTAQGLVNACRGLAGKIDEALGMPQVRELLTFVAVMASMLPPVQRSLPHLTVSCRCAACRAGKASVQGGLRPSGSISTRGQLCRAGVLPLRDV